MSGRLADQFLPAFDVSCELAVVVEADPDRVWTALMDLDLIELARRRRLVAVLGAIRALPEIVRGALHGRRPPAPPKRLTLRESTELPEGQGNWTLLDERPGEELALGLVGKFWRPVIEYAAVDAKRFMEFAEPDFAKTVYALGVRPLDGGPTLLWATMRTATTTEHARLWFRRYWTLGVGSGAQVLVTSLLETVRDECEAVVTA